jgi:citrate lyase beta subunit
MPEAQSAPSQTPLYQLVETRLGRPLVDYIAENKPTRSWKWMAADLTERTTTQVSWETLRLWFADRIQVEVTVK